MKKMYCAHEPQRWTFCVLSLCAVLFILNACALNQPLGQGGGVDATGDQCVVALVFREDLNDFVPTPVLLKDLTRLGSLEGPFVSIDYGARISSTWIVSGKPFDVNLIRKDGCFYPMDYPSLMLVTIYHHFQRAWLYFYNLAAAAGITCDACFERRMVYVSPSISGQPYAGMTDNAAYVVRDFQGSDEGFFIVFPQVYLNYLYMGANEIIIAHEFTHSIFDELITLNSAYNNLANYNAESYALMYGINEGSSDYYAFRVTGGLNPLRHSVWPEERYYGPRQIDTPRTLSQKDYDTLKSVRDRKCQDFLTTCVQMRNEYQYIIGTVYAHTLYKIGLALDDHDLVAKIVLDFYDQFVNLIPDPGQVTLINVFTELIGVADTYGYQDEFCQYFEESFDVIDFRPTCP